MRMPPELNRLSSDELIVPCFQDKVSTVVCSIARDNDSAIRACKPFPLVDPGDPRYVDISVQ